MAVGNPSTFTICALNVYFYLGGSSQDRAYSEEATMLSPRGYYQNGPYGNSYFEPDAITGEVGNMQAHFTLFTGDVIVLSISGWDEGDVGTHTIEATPAVVKGNASNYSTGLYQKTYKVIAAPLTVTTSTESKVYDGTPLTGKATLTGLADWDKDKVTATASSLTDAGSVSNTCTIDWGEVNPANYTITEEIGKLTVTPLEVSVDLGGGEYVYGDTYDAPRLTYKNGEHEEENATGECVSDGKTESVWKLALDTGDTLSLIIEKTEASLTGACEIGEPDGEDRASCYTVSFTNGDLTLAPLQIQVDLCGRDRVFGEYESGAYYDGYFSDFPLTYMNGQCKGENVEQTGYASGMGTSKVSYSAFTGEEFELSITNYCEKNAGTYTVGRTLTMTEGDDHLLDFSYINGSYTVSKRPVTVATSTENKVFDGTPLTGTATIKNVVTYKGEPDSRVTVTATGTLTDAGAADNTCTIDWGGADPANFDVTQELGTLSVEPLEIVIRLYDKTMEYFGKPIVSAYWDGYGNGTRAGDTLDWTGEYTAEADGSQKLIFTLCSGDTLTAVIPGFGPDVGSYSLMPSWTISGNAANYTVSVSGCTGTITPAPLTVSTQSADKVYDGTPLTAPGTISGLIDADAGKVSVITAGITDAGTADNTYTIDWGTVNPDNYTVTSGTLGTLTVEKLILNFSVSDVTHTYTTSLPTVPFPTVSLTYGNGGHAGETVSYTSRQYNGYLETGVVTAEPFFYTLFTGDRVCQYVSGMKQDVGTYTITAPCCGVADDDTNMSNFSASCNTAAWTVTPRGLTVTTSSASKPYDGTPLTSGSVTVSGLTDLDAAKITVTATGTITDFGTAVNTYAIDWGGVNPDNYTVTENLGTLKIEKTDMPITLTSADAEGVYTPWGLSNSNYTVEGLPAGFTLTAEITGLQTVGGSSSNTIASWTITNANGEDVTEYFTGVTPVEGTLTLTKAKIDIWSVNETFIYGSGWHSSHIYYSGAYSADNPSGQISSYNPATVKDAGTYEATFTVGEIRSDLQDRYELGTITFGTIKIEPLKLTVNLDGRTLTYNGDFVSLPVPSLTIENGDHAGETLAPSSTDGDAFNLEAKFDLFTGDTVTVTILNFDVIYAGTYDITYTCDAGTNFSVEFTGKTVTVKPTALTISTDNETKVYDGGMLPSTTKPPVLTGSCDDVIYTESTAEWFSDVGTRENSGKIVWNGADENNYTVTEDFGTLTIEELQLEIDLHGQTVESDWTFDLENPTMKYLNGAHPGESVPGTQTDPTSDGDVTFTLFTGETIRVVVARPPEEPGTYTLSATVTCSGRKENFLFSYTGAQFVINP